MDRTTPRVEDNNGGDTMANKGEQKKRQQKTNKPKLTIKEKKAKKDAKRAAKQAR